MSRDHRSLHDVRSLLGEIRTGEGGRHRALSRSEQRAAKRLATEAAAETRVLEPVDVLIPPISEADLSLIQDLYDLGADVRVLHGHDETEQCPCQVEGAVAMVRIYDGDRYLVVCPGCAPAEVEKSRAEAVVAEVCVR